MIHTRQLESRTPFIRQQVAVAIIQVATILVEAMIGQPIIFLHRI